MSRRSVVTDDDLESSADSAQRYGPAAAAALGTITAAVQQRAAAIVDEFYGCLTQLPGPRLLIETLSVPELEHLKSQQSRNLLLLADPELTEHAHRAVALRVGRIHTIIGLAREDLLHCQDILHAAVCHHVDTAKHSEALSVLACRLIRDVAWQMEAYQQLQDARQQLLLDITQLAWGVDSYTDLIAEAADLIGRHEEVAGCSFGRPDDEDRFRFEAASGGSIKRYLSELERSASSPIMAGDRVQGQGPTGRAWQTGKVERCLNFATDPRIAPWRAVAQREGIRSSAAVPLGQPGGPPTAILTLYSAFPGGYASPEQATFVMRLQTLLAFALTRIESHQGRTNTIPYGMRQHWAALLRSDALVMHYQPMLELHSGKATRVEALARLRDGDRVLAPDAFFSALSSDDFVELYVRGLGQALCQRNRWLLQGFDINISVNLPSSALGDTRYLSATERALHEHGCPPRKLTLEVLETDEAAPGVDIAKALAKFKALDICLAEDDLGSGHSSLTRLRMLPFDSFKIDRSIVALADEDRSNVLRFIYQLSRLGHSIGKTVVVEGVETMDLLEAIAILGADAVQGYAVARPMPAPDLAEWMGKNGRFTLADRRRPASALAKLARLLVWEEHLHLLLGEAPACGRPAGTRVPAADSAWDAGDGHDAQAVRDSGSFMGTFGDGAAFLPFESVDATMQRALVDAAVSHGPRSAEYGAARHRLVGVLTAS